MTLHQVSALFSVAFLLAAVITAMYGSEISGALGGAWARGSAQATAEKRRLQQAARAARSSGTWQAAKDAARETRGAVRDAADRARKENGPLRRVVGAAATGARLGWRIAGAAGRHRPGSSGGWRARPQGGTRGRGGYRKPRTRRDGSGAGWRPRGGRRRPACGVCDNCGRNVSRKSLQELAGQMQCYLCRRKYQPGGNVPVPAGQPLPHGPAASGAVPAGARAVPVQGPAPRRIPLPGPQEPERVGAGSAAAALRAGSPARGAADSPVLVAAGTIPAITGGTTMTANAAGSGRPGSAVAVRPGAAAAVLDGTVAGLAGSRVAVRPQSSVAPGDTTTHGEWVRNAEIVVVNLGEMFRYVQRMTEDLAAGDCPDELITAVAGWAETIYRHGRQVLAELLQIDGGLRPWIDAVAAAGGWRNVASPRWLEGR